MSMSYRFAAAALLAALSYGAQAQQLEPSSPPPPAGPVVQAAPMPPRAGFRSGGASLSDAVRRVQRTTGGQILGAEQVQYEGGSFTRIKYMDDRGRVRYMDDPGPAGRQARAAPRSPRGGDED